MGLVTLIIDRPTTSNLASAVIVGAGPLTPDDVVAVARENNFSSRTVLGAIGMRPCELFVRNGNRMILYESLAPTRHGSAR